MSLPVTTLLHDLHLRTSPQLSKVQSVYLATLTSTSHKRRYRLLRRLQSRPCLSFGMVAQVLPRNAQPSNAIQSIPHVCLIELLFHLPESTCIISTPSCKHSSCQPPPVVVSDNQDLQHARLHLHLQTIYVLRPTLPKTNIPRAVFHSTGTSGAPHPPHRSQPVARG